MKIDKQGQEAIQSLILDLVPHLTCDTFLVSPGRGYFDLSIAEYSISHPNIAKSICLIGKA